MTKVLLSPYEKKFFLEYKLNPDRFDHNIVSAHILTGDIDFERLNLILSKLVSNYYLLNAHVNFVDNEELYWRANSKYFSLKRFKKLSTQEIYSILIRPFDLESGPLYRFFVVEESTTITKFFLILHHIIVNDDSIRFLCDKISEYYNDTNSEKKESIDLQISQHTTFSQKYNSYINSNKKISKEFWNTKFKDVKPVNFEFLIDSSSKTVAKLNDTPYQEELSIVFNEKDVEKLKRVRDLYKISPYIFSQIVFAILIYRYSGCSRFCINYPVAIKDEIKLNFGANLNINIIPYDFTSSKSLIELIVNTRSFIKSITTDQVKHTLLPIIEILESFSSNILEIAFTQTNLQKENLSLNKIKSSVDHSYRVDLSGDIIFEQGMVTDNFAIKVRYNKNIIDKNLLESFLGTYKRIHYEILTDLIENLSNGDFDIFSYKLVQDLDCLDNYKQLSDMKARSKYTIKDKFEEIVIKYGQSPALIYKSKKVSFSDLNSISNKIAHFLINSLSNKNVLVTLFLEKTDSTIFTILGIIKSGKAYVPIETDHPNERIAFILKDTKSKLIFTENKYKQRIKNLIESIGIDCKIISIDNPSFILSLEKEKNLNPIIHFNENNLAYVIYTSGTTGTPKGVMVEHKGVVNFVDELLRLFNLKQNSQEVVSLISNYGFDASVEQIFLPILSGNTLLIIPDKMWLNRNNFFEYLTQNNISHIHATPKFIEQFDFKNVPTLKRLVLGGESVSKETFNKISCSKLCKIISEYGPAETTVTASVNIMENVSYSMKIGSPIANMNFYILDEKLQPLPKNVVGELCISGVGVARGYLNQKDLSKIKFVNNPFQKDSSSIHSIMYRTGDLCKFLPNGQIKFVGRSDFQVKIAGYRIELHEIESAIVSHPEIQQSVVIANNSNHNDDKYLVGFYVSGNIVELEELFEFLSTKLPHYMTPRMLYRIDKIPLTHNGKVDINALSTYKEIDMYLKPSGKIATTLAKIWSEILGCKKVGMYDNFFSLGGNSLLAMRTAARAQEEGIAIHVSTIYQSKHLSQLVNTVKSLRKIKKSTFNENIDKKPRISLFQKHWLEKYKKDPSSFNIPVIFTLEGFLNKDLLKNAFKNISIKHDALRTVFKEDNSEGIIPIIASKENFNFDEISLLNKNNKKKRITLEIQQFVERDFALKDNPTLRVLLIEVSAKKNVLVLVLNHFNFDSISFDILINELCIQYNSFINKPDIDKYGRVLQYSTFTNQHYLKSEQDVRLINLDKIVDILSLQDLRTIIPFATRSNFKNSKYVTREISFDKLDLYKRFNIVTNTSFSLAICVSYLFALSKCNSITIPYFVTVRPTYDTMSTIGCFSHVFPITVKLLHNEMTFNKILQSVETQISLVREIQNLPIEFILKNKSINYKYIESNILFVSQNMNDVSFKLNRLKLGKIEYENEKMREEFCFESFENNKIITFKLHFEERIFTEEAEKVLLNLTTFIEKILSQHGNVTLSLLNSS
ncbi:MAG: amino acid adenylation domain-containing protein [Proteobacteria bacterium]|nr:amino acid adenylation domain-containing protein [Pseudomonadota bacterium]